MGKKVDAVAKELDQLTSMCQKSLHDAAMRWQTFEQLNGSLFDCNKSLLARVMALQKEGKVGSDIIELADGDKEAAWYIKTHFTMRGNAVVALKDYKKAIALLGTYSKRITVVQKNIKGLISDREIGIKSAKSLPRLAKCEKEIAKLGVDFDNLIKLSDSMPKLHLDL